jgi:hypothetical protein
MHCRRWTRWTPLSLAPAVPWVPALFAGEVYDLLVHTREAPCLVLGTYTVGKEPPRRRLVIVPSSPAYCAITTPSSDSNHGRVPEHCSLSRTGRRSHGRNRGVFQDFRYNNARICLLDELSSVRNQIAGFATWWPQSMW